ncbi:MAG: hypothetical protein ABL962_01930 [Fimbriimonadaceae bacterium]
MDKNVDMELEAISTIISTLNKLDRDAVQRVLGYVCTRLDMVISTSVGKMRQPMTNTVTAQQADSGEVPGIAKLSEAGALTFTVRDLKAKSTTDAAIRIAHVAIFANELLTGERAMSSRKVLVPILREYRAYDSNARTALARHKGILRSGDMLSLDAHSKRDAEQYVNDILDDGIEGKWKPRTTVRRRPPTQRPKTGETE